MTATAKLRAEIELALDRFTLDVSLDTHAHVTGLFGASGSGKTSFLETVAGLRRQARGTLRFGEAVWQDSAAGLFVAPDKRGIGYVPQDGLLFPRRSVERNLESGLRRVRREGADGEGIRRNVVELLELAPLLGRDVGTLSGGERQRVVLGRALCSAPRLLLLDEPLAALDQPLRHRILPFLRRIREEFDIPMILVSHDPFEVQALCDDLVVLRAGSIVARGAPRDVLTDPAVFPIARERGFENVVACTTVGSDEWATTVRLGADRSAPTLTVTNVSAGPRRARLVGIPARDVMVATREPRAISARNVLPAVITEVYVVDSFVLLKASLGDGLPAIAVEVGRPASLELALEPGRKVHLIIKAMSCTLYDEASR